MTRCRCDDSPIALHSSIHSLTLSLSWYPLNYLALLNFSVVIESILHIAAWNICNVWGESPRNSTSLAPDLPDFGLAATSGEYNGSSEQRAEVSPGASDTCLLGLAAADDDVSESEGLETPSTNKFLQQWYPPATDEDAEGAEAFMGIHDLTCAAVIEDPGSGGCDKVMAAADGALIGISDYLSAIQGTQRSGWVMSPCGTIEWRGG